MDGLSSSDVALLSRDGDMLGSGGAFFWILALIILGGGNFGFGGNGRGDYVTQSDLTSQLNAQGINGQLQQIAVETANNNYETAQLINNQTNQMLQQNSTNLITAIQGFNAIQQSIAGLGTQIAQLGYHMDSCCCEIKTQMLKDRLDDAQAKLVAAQGVIDNANQSQYILSQLGKFVPTTAAGT